MGAPWPCRWLLPLLLAAVPSAGYKALETYQTCNGSPKLCVLPFNEVTLPGHHNAEAHNLKLRGVEVPCATDSHKHGILGALDLGMRFFDLDTCMMDASGGHEGKQTVRSCHGPAMGRPLAEILKDLAKWLALTRNRYEVVAISFAEAMPEDHSREKKEAMLEAMMPIVEEHLGDLMLRPDDLPAHGGWPTLAQMVVRNRRVVVLWGRLLWFAMYTADHENPSKKYMKRHFESEEQWTGMWKGDYAMWDVEDLKNYMVSFCEQSFTTQPLVMADAYLSMGSRGTKDADFCNEDLAADVNPEVLAGGHAAESPLLEMQTRCWSKQRHVSMVMMDFASQFGARVDAVVSVMNERNFARYGWIGGVADLGTRIYNTGAGVAREEQQTAELTEQELRTLLARVGAVDIERIGVDGTKHQHGSTLVYFTIRATEGRALQEMTNLAVLEGMRAAVKHGAMGGLRSIRMDCGDPGHPENGVRTPDGELGFTEGAVVTFECDFGYASHGSVKRTCGADGFFTGVQPVCKLEIVKRWRRTRLSTKIFVVAGLIASIVCFVTSCQFLCRICGQCMQRRAFRILFNELDHMGDGFINKEELLEVVSRMDASMEGRVGYDDYAAVLQKGHEENAAFQKESSLFVMPGEEETKLE